MPGEVSYILGTVALPYAVFEWPKYRGTIARRVTIDCPAGMYDQLANMARSLAGKPTTLTVTGPAGPGNNPADEVVKIEGVYIDRVVLMSEHYCRVMCYDARLILARRVADMDFNQSFGDGVLEGTDYGTYRLATQAWVQSIDVLKNGVNPDYLQRVPQALTLGREHFAGMTLPYALGAFVDKGGFDFTVRTDGGFTFADRADIAGASDLPRLNDYHWFQEPGWAQKAATITGIPRKVYSYYHERHCLRMEGGDPDATVARYGPEVLRIELEQVYRDEGQIYTLEELLAAHNFGTNELTDAQIAGNFWTETFEGATISTAYGTSDFDAVHKAVRADWRRCWRIKPGSAIGKIGAWKDWVFGKINADGSVVSVAVECPWVEFLTTPAPQPGSGFVGAALSVNHDKPAKFTPVWIGDESSGVFYLAVDGLLDGNTAVPGALTVPVKIERRDDKIVKGAGGEGYTPAQDFFVVESMSWAKAKFNPNFTIYVYACATKCLPNNETRWHREAVTGEATGDVDYVELPVGDDLYCVRDYVDPTDPAHAALGDGLGPILNQAVLTSDAERGATAWMLTHTARLEGDGVAESIKAFKDVEVKGPISEVTLVASLEGPDQAPVVRTRITVGNLGDFNSRRREATVRQANRSFKTAGVQ